MADIVLPTKRNIGKIYKSPTSITFGAFNQTKEGEIAMDGKQILNYPVFDGIRVHEAGTVVIENGRISSETVLGQGGGNTELLLIPGLMDGHTHLYAPEQTETMARNGITATCAVSVSEGLARQSKDLKIWTSRSMALGNVTDGKAYVEREIAAGADYIKVILEDPPVMAPKTMEAAVLRDIVRCAHVQGLKVAAHAVSNSTVRLAVDAGVDILLHVPLAEPLTVELAEKIARQNMAVVPTLAMMEAFANDPRFFFYKPEHYANAEAGVRLLHSLGVPILTGTDSCDVPYAPQVRHGTSLHHELELLVNAGLTPIEALQGATSKMARCFGLKNVGKIAQGYAADLVLVEGRPDRCITDSTKIRQIWVDGKPIL